MTRQEYAESLVKISYQKYGIALSWDKLPWSGELIDVQLNDGRTEIVDRLVEFTLCSLYSYYFIDRYCFTIPPVGGPIPFRLFDFQLKALNAFQTNKFNIFRKSRQVGASVISGCYALWRANFHKAETIKVISLTQKDAVEFKEKTIDINYDMMPGFLKSKTRGQTRPSRMQLELINRSSIKVLSKSKNAGRGGTPSLMIIDEAAFNEWMDDIWKSVEPSLDKGGSIIVISTTNGVGNWYHITYTKAEDGQNEFHPIFIPWWRYPGRSNPWLDDLLKKIKTNEWTKNQVKKFIEEKKEEQLSYEGNPKTAPWLWKRRHNAKTEKDFQQEILAEFLGSGESVITPASIQRIEKGIRDPISVDALPQPVIERPIPGLWCWKDVQSTHQYIMAVDTATGHGKDFSVFQLIDVNTNEQAAEYKYQIPTDQFGVIIKYIARYYNQAYVMIECNHPGPAVFNEVYLSKTDPYYNVYARNKGKDVVSWETTPKSRVLLIEAYFKDIENGYTKIYSERLLEEIKVFIWNDNGKAEAMKGYNDDLVIAYSIYCCLKDNVFSSRPMGILSSQTLATDPEKEEKTLKWMQQEDFYEENYGMTMEEYYWIQGKPLPHDYVEYKKEQQKMLQELESSNLIF